MILVDGERVVAELKRANVVVPHTRAAEAAGRCAQDAGLLEAAVEDVALMRYERGYVWAIFYTHGKERTHFALIHADGTPLSKRLSDEVIEADSKSSSLLKSLEHIAPSEPRQRRAALAPQVMARYRTWIEQECGQLQLDGLPADMDLSATRFSLEKLYVPLKVSWIPRKEDPNGIALEQREVLSIGQLLSKFRHVAVLGSPGSGKSTMLKRLAADYPASMADSGNESRPIKDALPLFVRCRELGDRSRAPILECLEQLPKAAGMSGEEDACFRFVVHEALRDGRAVLLIDGLDEISDEGSRTVFAQNLRTFTGMFPQVTLVLTSREAGFRLIAGVIASVCQCVRLDGLEDADIASLCERWYTQAGASGIKGQQAAREIVTTICETPRLKALAGNPLLLTTLLVVKRWIGELPRNRAALYREAVKVLIRTWNVEGYQPLDEEETLTQLSYVACAMMRQGRQQISHNALLQLLRDSRRELDAELQFASISESELVRRVEHRSSLLMQTGSALADGHLQAVYEFRHLTFQEYLAGRGFACEQYPGRDAGDRLVDLLRPHFSSDRWREVIPLAAAIAGRRAEEVILALTEACRKLPRHEQMRRPAPEMLMLWQAILDEVQIGAGVLRSALAELGIADGPDGPRDKMQLLFRSKFGPLCGDIYAQLFGHGEPGWDKYAMAAAFFAYEETAAHEKDSTATILKSLVQGVANGDRLVKLQSTLAFAEAAYRTLQSGSTADAERLLSPDQKAQLETALDEMLLEDELPRVLAACWALAAGSASRLLTLSPTASRTGRLYGLWQNNEGGELFGFAAWAVGTQALLERDSLDVLAWKDSDGFLRRNLRYLSVNRLVRTAILTLGWYRRGPWSDGELQALLRRVGERDISVDPTLNALWKNLQSLSLSE